MIATAIYSNGTHFYGTDKVYYELSEGELTKIRSILSKQLPKMIPVNTIGSKNLFQTIPCIYVSGAYLCIS